MKHPYYVRVGSLGIVARHGDFQTANATFRVWIRTSCNETNPKLGGGQSVQIVKEEWRDIAQPAGRCFVPNCPHIETFGEPLPIVVCSERDYFEGNGHGREVLKRGQWLQTRPS